MDRKQEGQSTIEFILTFGFGLGIIFLFVNVSINYAAGYLVHYATFMSARTYLTVDGHSTADSKSATDAKEEARKTFSRFRMNSLGINSATVGVAGGVAEGFYINNFFPPPPDPKDTVYVGAYTIFDRPLSIFQIVAGGDKAKHISEAFLGKEPTRAGCWQRTCQAIMLGLTGTPTACDPMSANDFTVFDNGC